MHDLRLIGSLAALWRLAPEQRLRFTFAAVLGTVSAFCALAPAAIVYFIGLNVLEPGAQGLMIRPWVLWAVVAVEVRFALLFASRILARVGAVSASYSLRVRLASALGSVPLGFFNVHQSGELKHTVIEDVDGVQAFFAEDFIEVVSAVVIPIAIVVGFFVVDWRLALASIVSYPLLAWVQRRLVLGAQQQRIEFERARDRVNAATAEFTRGIVLQKSFGQSHESVRVLETAIERYRSAYRAQVDATALPASLMRTLTSSNLFVVIPLGLYLNGMGAVGLATLVFFGLFNLRLSGALLRLAKLTSTVVAAGVNARRIEEILAEPALPDAGTREEIADASIRFQDVTFHYSSDASGRAALRDIALSVPAGGVTAVVGLSGAGKTTLARLAARFWDVDRGAVQIGGSDVREYRLERLMDRIAFVFQEAYLLDDTVVQNIRLGRRDLSDEQVIAAAKAARAHDFIVAMPEGYRTVVGRNGLRLSQGERQRIQVARALLKNAPILILDEATASTDPENEAMIQDALATLARDKTVLVIAHRLSTVVEADKIVVLDAGKVVAEGTHPELLATSEHYRRLWHDYNKSFEWTLSSPERAAR
ncbi:MAG: ABC transporter ATP-binding protein [Candidatus Baltobacteraceae bacterium]|jgi:ATP-binding cassette subfamily B protein